MIRTSEVEGVRRITIDRPDKRNALRPVDLSALEEALADAVESVVYLHGAGEVFCAGGDLEVVDSLDGGAAREFASHGQRVARALEEYEGVVVAGIDGAARGGGMELALGCDLRIATPDATLAEPGVSLGLFGAWGGTARLPDIVGLGNALDLGLSGRVLEAPEAKEMGLVSRVVADPFDVARDLAGNDALAMRILKERTRATGDRSRQEAAEADALARLIRERRH